MNRLIAASLVAALFLLVPAMNASAFCGGQGAAGCPMSSGNTSVSPEALANFNKDSAPLQEKLIDKSSELRKEYIKTQPDTDKIAKLKKEMIDIQADIQKIAAKYGITSAQCSFGGCKGRGRGCGMN